MTDISPVTDAPKYPLVSLQSSLELAAAVRDAGGANVDVPKSVIASHLNSSDTSGAFLQRIGSARSFGLIEGRGTYHLTEEAKRYFFPANESERNRAQLVFLGSPIVYSEIIKRFDGSKLPASGMLANILHREYGVAESWKDRVASSFVKAAQTFGAVDGQNFLRYRARLHAMESPLLALDVLKPSTPEATGPIGLSVAIPSGADNSWFFKMDGQFVRLETSAELSAALWEKLQAYVAMLKPTQAISP